MSTTVDNWYPVPFLNKILNKIRDLSLGLKFKASESIQLMRKGCFFHYSLAICLPIESKFSQVCYCLHLLGYTKWEHWSLTQLKTLDTFGNCQRPVISLGGSLHVTNLWKFGLNWLSKLRDKNGRKNTLVTQVCVISDAWIRDLKI